MSVLWAGNMRGPRVQTRLSRPLLLLLLLLSRSVSCQEEDAEPEPEVTEEEAHVEETVEEEATAPEEEATDPSENGLDTTPIPTVTDATDTEPSEFPTEAISGTEETPGEDEGLDLLLIAVPVALVVLIVTISVCGVFIHRRLNSKNRHSEVRKEDPYLEGSSTEKVPMPMFEEDVPSVLELEMDELDDWMKKDGQTADFNQQV